MQIQQSDADGGINPLIPPQPPPTPQTQPSNIQDPAGTVMLVAVGFVVFLSLYRRRQNALHNLRNFTTIGVLAYVAYLLARSDPNYLAAAPLIAGLVGFMFYAMRPKRGRNISKSVRRTKIKEWESKTGKRFNPRKHELDHIVPFSKGGSHTGDNLRVLEKGLNRSKGAQNPWWDIFGLWQ